MDFDIISLLPEQARPTALLIMQTIITVAGVVAIAKPAIVKAIGEPSSSDSRGKQLIFGLLRVLDWVALQSPNVTSRKQLSDVKKAACSADTHPALRGEQ